MSNFDYPLYSIADHSQRPEELFQTRREWLNQFGTGFGMLFPTMKTILIEATSSHNRGRAFGVFYAIYSLGVVVGSTGSGVILEFQGDAGGGPFIFGAAAALTAIPITVFVEMLRKQPSSSR